jgi:hypothetical protein
MKLQNRSEVDRLIGYMNAMSRCLNGCNYVTWFDAKSIEFDQKLDFGDLESLGRLGHLGTPPNVQLQELIRLAYPRSKPDCAFVADANSGVMMKKLNQFIAYINTEDGSEGLTRPKKKDLVRGFWEHVKDCADVNQSHVLEYIPAISEDDMLGQFIFWGFTFLIFSQDKKQCLMLHCGASD